MKRENILFPSHIEHFTYKIIKENFFFLKNFHHKIKLTFLTINTFDKALISIKKSPSKVCKKISHKTLVLYFLFRALLTPDKSIILLEIKKKKGQKLEKRKLRNKNSYHQIAKPKPSNSPCLSRIMFIFAHLVPIWSKFFLYSLPSN